MKLDDQDQLIAEFKEGLQKRILRAVVAVLILFYFLYLLIKLLTLRAQINHFHDGEFSYLKGISTSPVGRHKYQYQSILNFLDSSRILLQMRNNNIINESLGCNRMMFDCYITTPYNYTDLTKYYAVLSSNVKSLVGIQEVSSIFTYSNNSYLFFNMTALGWKSAKNISQSVLQSIFTTIANNNSSISRNPYIFVNVMLNDTNCLNILCKQVFLSGAGTKLCVLIQMAIMGFIPLTSNYYYLTNNIITDRQMASLQLFSSILSGQIYASYPKQQQQVDIFDCLKELPSLYTSYTNFRSGLDLRCQSQSKNKRLNSFGPYYSFIYYSDSLGIEVTNSQISNAQSYQYFVSSNSSYYSVINTKISKTIRSIRLTSYCILGILGLLLGICVRWIDAMESGLIPSLNFIIKLCELVKGKQEKQFHKLVGSYKPENLSFLINYFQQYLWVCRLLRIKSRKKPKKLLLRGLALFNQNHFVPILQYIYSQLIFLELERINNLLHIRNLQNKKNNLQAEPPKKPPNLLPPTFPQLHNLAAQPQADKRRPSKRRNANMRLLDPDDDQLMKNISMSYRLHHSVRFSNDVQMVQVDQGPIIRKTKFAEAVESCETIKNDLSEAEESLKASENKESLRDEGESYTSLAEMGRVIRKKSSSFKNRSSLESIHGDLNNFKFDEEDFNPDDNLDWDSHQNEDCLLSGQAILAETRLTYQSLIRYFQEAVNLKMKKLPQERDQQLFELVNDIYDLTLQKYHQIYEMLVYENEYQLQTEEDRDNLVEFKDLYHLQLFYSAHLRHQLVQHGEILRLQIQHALGLPVSFKNIQFLKKSQQPQIKIESRQLLAEACQQYQPHLDWVVFHNVFLNLLPSEKQKEGEKTTIKLKARALRVLSDNLQRYPDFQEELRELRMVKQFYNPKNRKFYFLTSINSLKPFNSLLLRFFQLIKQFDIINMYNLQEAQSLEPQQIEESINAPKRKKRDIVDNIKYQLGLQAFLELFSEGQKDKEAQEKNASVKTISRRLIYEREFHEILGLVQNDQAQCAKYMVLLLGEEHAQHSGETQDSSSNNNNRPYQQLIHQQISKIINQGYFHIILIGHQLNAYPSRYGRLKRYVKLSPQLLELDLADKDQQNNSALLEKFLR